MTQQNQAHSLVESLSALMDNQAEELELQRLLKASGSDPALLSTWSRYQLTRSALKGDMPVVMASADFASRVSAALESEAAHVSVAGLNANNDDVKGDDVRGTVVRPVWWQSIGRAAIAASVAGALVLGVQQYQSLAPQTTELAGSAPTTAPAASEVKAADLPSGINAPALAARAVAVQSGYESRPQENRRVIFVPRQEAAAVNNEEISVYVNHLIEAHSDNAAANSGQGMLPYTRVILVEEEGSE